jgi:hypothetical protein
MVGERHTKGCNNTYRVVSSFLLLLANSMALTLAIVIHWFNWLSPLVR